MKDTKHKILETAQKLFIEHGYAGTSIGNIARTAEINHSLVFHHFGNKEKLWTAVKANIVSEARTPTLPSTKLSLEKFIRNLLVNSYQFYINTPELIRLFNWQRLEKNHHENIGINQSQESKRWLNAFKHYQTRGDIKHTVKAEFILTMIVSLSSSAALDPNVFLNDSNKLNAYLDFCVESILSAIKNTHSK